MILEGEPNLIPLCIDTGSLINAGEKEIYGLDNFGIAVSIYFKLLKSFIIFFSFCTIICVPLYFLYSCGNMSKQATGAI